jgi:ABC-type nitrate/sulfonate/bicarbonate transport system substrate-binding protein
VQRDPALVRDVVAALQGALDLLHAEPDHGLMLLSKRFPGVSPAVAKAALNRALKDGVIPRTTTISEEAWNRAISLRIEVGDLKEAAPYSRFVWLTTTAGK